MSLTVTGKQNNNQQRFCKPINIISLVAGIVLCVVLGTLIVHADALDDVVLLEEKNPGYFALSNGKIYSCNDENTDNLLRLDNVGTGRKELTCTVNADSSITIKGYFDDADQQSFHISYGNYIPEGTYTYTDGAVSTDSAFLYSEQWIRTITGEDEKGATIYSVEKSGQCRLPERSQVIITSSYNWYWFGGMVPGRKAVNVTFYPCVNESGAFSPGWMLGDQSEYKRYIVSISEKTECTDKDLRLFKNMLRKQYPEVTSVEIDFVDEYNTVLKRIISPVDKLNI